MCAVPNRAVFCSSWILRFPCMLLRYCLSDFEVFPVAPLLLTSLLFLHSTCSLFMLYCCCRRLVTARVPFIVHLPNNMNEYGNRRNSNGRIHLRYSKCVLSVQVTSYTPNPTLNVTEAKFSAGEVQSQCCTDRTLYWPMLDVCLSGYWLTSLHAKLTSAAYRTSGCVPFCNGVTHLFNLLATDFFSNFSTPCS